MNIMSVYNILDVGRETTPDGKPKYRRYWPAPPFIDHIYEYQDVNKDVNLRKDVTEWFVKKILHWIESDDDFKKLKNKKKYFESVDGNMEVYKFLRYFVKKANINWYDLRSNCKILKHYFSKKLQ
jgi:hypothetical protein